MTTHFIELYKCAVAKEIAEVPFTPGHEMVGQVRNFC